jgi:hypothetical protein
MKLKILSMVIMLVFVLAACTDTEGSAVTVTEGYMTLEVDETYALDVLVTGNLGDALSFQSKDPNVASVSGAGVVTAVGAGETLITVRVGSSSDFVVVRVNGDRVVAFDEMDFLAAWDRGEYRIELQKDLVLNETLEVDRPFEIVFNGYTLEADFKVVADFEGGLAFNNALSDDQVLSLTETDLQAYKGTVDLNGFLVEVYSNFLQMVDPETFDDYIINPFGVQDRSYTYLYDYVNVGDRIPVANIDDVMNIQADAPHVFAKGTPYERLVAVPRMYQNYVLVNDIQGELTAVGKREVLVRDFDETDLSDEVYVFNDGVFESSFENIKSPNYQIAYENALFQLDLGASLDIPVDLDASIQTYLTDNGITPVNYYEITEYQYEGLERHDTLLSDVVIFGNDFTIRYFELEDGDALLDEAFGHVELRNISFEYLVGQSSGDEDSKGLIFNYVSTTRFLLNNIEIKNNYYQAMSDGSENFAIFVGDFGNAGYLEMNHISVFDNKLYSNGTDDIGIVFGEMEDFTGHVSRLYLVGNLIVQDKRGRDLGLFAGFMDWATLTVNEFDGYRNTIYAPNAHDAGMFVGTMDQTKLTLNVFFNEELTFIAEDNMGIIVGDLYDSFVTMNDVYLEWSNLQGKNDIGLLFGEINDVRLEGVNIEAFNNSIIGTYNLGGVIGQISDESRVDLSHVFIGELSIEGTYQIGGFAGELGYSDLYLNDFGIRSSTLTGNYEIGSVIGEADNSSVYLSRASSYFTELIANYNVGGVIGRTNDSHMTLLNSEVVALSVTPRTADVTNLNTVGGVTGYAEHSYVDIFNTYVNLINTLRVDSYYGGVAGKFEDGTLIVRQSNFFSTVEAVSDHIGGSLGYVNDSNVLIANSDHELFVSDFNDVKDLNRIGGMAGRAHDSIIKIERSSFVSSFTGVIYDIGGFIGKTLRTHVDTLGLYVVVEIAYDASLALFDATTMGDLIGHVEDGLIKIYYSNISKLSIDLNGFVDIYDTVLPGIGKYTTNYLDSIDPVVLRVI